MFRQPVLVFEGSENLTAAHQRALGRDLKVAVYTTDMFVTGHDEANRAAVRRSAAPTSTWSGSRCTVRRTPSTR